MGAYGTGWAQITDDIFVKFNTVFPTLQSSTEIAWPNVGFEPNPGEPFVRISILPGETLRVALGNDRLRRVGVISVQVFTPAGRTVQDNMAIVDDVVSTFRGATISNLRLQPAAVNSIGPSGQHYQTNITINFTSDLQT